VISWITGSMFMSVWGMAMDSILQCFCIDKELNHGSGKQNLYCPGQLLKFVEDPKWKDKIAKADAKKKKSQDQFTEKKMEDPEHGERKCCTCC